MRQAEIVVGERKAVKEQSIEDYEFMVEQIQAYLSNYLDNHSELTPYIIQNEATEELKTEFAFIN